MVVCDYCRAVVKTKEDLQTHLLDAHPMTVQHSSDSVDETHDRRISSRTKKKSLDKIESEKSEAAFAEYQSAVKQGDIPVYSKGQNSEPNTGIISAVVLTDYVPNLTSIIESKTKPAIRTKTSDATGSTVIHTTTTTEATTTVATTTTAATPITPATETASHEGAGVICSENKGDGASRDLETVTKTSDSSVVQLMALSKKNDSDMKELSYPEQTSIVVELSNIHTEQTLEIGNIVPTGLSEKENDIASSELGPAIPNPLSTEQSKNANIEVLNTQLKCLGEVNDIEYDNLIEKEMDEDDDEFFDTSDVLIAINDAHDEDAAEPLNSNFVIDNEPVVNEEIEQDLETEVVIVKETKAIDTTTSETMVTHVVDDEPSKKALHHLSREEIHGIVIKNITPGVTVE